MLKPPVPPDEVARIAGLRDLNILDTPAEERFDRITRIAAAMFDVPVALISLVDSNRQWFKSCVGVTVSETPREISFCAHAILGDEIFYIPDTHQDERFRDNPLVTGEPHVRFYAGYPIACPNGKKVGTLCIVDHRPHHLSEADLQRLRDLGAWAHTELITIHMLQQEVSKQKEKQEEKEKIFFELMEGLPVGVFVLNENGNPYYANQTAQQILGKGIAPAAQPEEFVDVYHLYIAGTDEKYPAERRPLTRALAGKSSTVDDMEIHKPNEIIQVQVWGTPIFRNGKVAFAIAAFQDITDRKRAERRLAAQHAVTCVLAEAQTLAEATPKVLEAICGSVGWQVGAIWHVDSEVNALHCVDVWHPQNVNAEEFATLTRKFVFEPGVGLPGRVWATEQCAWIPDIVEDANFPRTPAALKNGLHAAFAFPILFGKEVTGVIEFFNRYIQKPDQALLTMMGTLGSQIGQFMARKQVEEDLKRSEERLRMIVGGKRN